MSYISGVLVVDDSTGIAYRLVLEKDMNLVVMDIANVVVKWIPKILNGKIIKSNELCYKVILGGLEPTIKVTWDKSIKEEQ